jgi:hypothetical protein
VSSRQEEKERRRQERLEREQAEARKAAGRRRMQLVAGGVLGAAAVAAVVIAVAAGGGDDKGGSNEPNGTSGDTAAIPAAKISDLNAAVKAAGCELKDHANEGRDHIADTETFTGYKTNPPTSGNHRQTPAEDGVYDAGNSPDANNWVHSLEHGRIVLQYKPGTPARRISQLETLFNEKLRGVEGYHQLLLQNNTKMPYAVAASAWTHLVGCREFTDGAFDVLRDFREKYVDKGPELIP